MAARQRVQSPSPRRASEAVGVFIEQYEHYPLRPSSGDAITTFHESYRKEG
jgi:hypothetical protein